MIQIKSVLLIKLAAYTPKHSKESRMQHRLTIIALFTAILSSACARETLFALPLEEEPPSEEVIDEAPEPEEEVVVPEPEPQPEPEVTPEEPEPQPEPEPEVTPEEPDPQPEPEEEVPPPVDDCEETSELLYAVDKNDGGLYLFDPVGGSFELLGIPDCGMFSGTPASMAVARNGIAYVRYSSSTLYAIDVETLECSETQMSVSSFGKFGMGYATLHGNTWQDELFIANRNTLAKLNTTTFQVENIGPLPSQSELTGNALGELWGVFPLETPAQIMELDRSSGQPQRSITLTFMPSPMNIDTFAFATWGGDFYVFLRLYGMGESTRVYRVSTTGFTEVLSNETGRNIVGVGVSTCAPTEQ